MIKDSGERTEFASGAVRDMHEGKGEMTMDDFISREAALACFHDWIDRYGHEHTADEMVEYQRIEELPVADAVDVVRCKDCKFYNSFFHNGFTEKYCGNHNALARVEDNGFCNFAERRSDNGD